MKITLKHRLKPLGDSLQVDVNKNLATGLMRRGQATKGWKTEKKDPLDSMTVKELQEIAKEREVSYSGLNKAELIKELKKTGSTKELKEPYDTK